MISRLFCFLYNTINHDEYKMSFLEGTVEDIVDNVHTGVSDIGIVYFSKDQHKRMSGIHLAIPVFSKGYRPKQGKVAP